MLRAFKAGEEKTMRQTKTRMWLGLAVAAAALALGGCATKEQAARTSEKVPVETVEAG